MYVIIRVRGRTGIRKEVSDTLTMMNLTRINHGVLMPDSPECRGMLQKVKDYVTWGEISPEVATKLIRSRGRLYGDIPISDSYIKENLGYNSLDDYSKALVEGKAHYKDIPNVKPVFRLHPPLKGWGKTKRHFKEGGALGYRGEKINDLVLRMLGHGGE